MPKDQISTSSDLVPTVLLSQPFSRLHEALFATSEQRETFPTTSVLGQGEFVSSGVLLGQGKTSRSQPGQWMGWLERHSTLGVQSGPSGPAQLLPQRFHPRGEPAKSPSLQKEREAKEVWEEGETNTSAPGKCHVWFFSSEWAVTAARWGRKQGEQCRFIAVGHARAEPSVLPSISFMNKMKCRTSSAGALLEEKPWESRNRECPARGQPAPLPSPVWVSPFQAGFGQGGDCNYQA